MGIVAERLNQAMKLRGLKQIDLVTRTGIGKSSISTYLVGSYIPKQTNLYKLANVLEVNPAWLMGEHVPMDNSASPVLYSSVDVLRIPILGTIPAGIPLEAVEDIVGWEELPAGMARGGKEYFGLKVTGDSMYPRYEDGDVLILRKQDTCESGQDCAVMVGNSDATFKRVRLGPSGVTLHPLNPSFETYHYTNQEVTNLPVRILGVVVELRRKI